MDNRGLSKWALNHRRSAIVRDQAHCGIRHKPLCWTWDGPAMPVSEFRLNRFERILFRIAIVLAAVIVAVRVGAMAALWLLHH